MSSFAWNEWTCVFDTLVIMNFADISKKGNKFHKVSAKNDDEKNVSKFFWMMGFSKELVIIVSNESILINTPFGTIWKKKLDTPRGTILKKMNKLFDHACLGKKWENPWFRNFFSISSKIK